MKDGEHLASRAYLNHVVDVMNSIPSVVATGNAVTPNAVVVPPRPPYTYLGMARALLVGVPLLARAGAPASIALAFVAAQVAECSLKAYLARSGDDERLKSPALRHNLEALWDLARIEGLPLSGQAPTWLLTLSVLHNKPYFIRYSTGVHALGTPAGEPMATELAAIVELVSQHL